MLPAEKYITHTFPLEKWRRPFIYWKTCSGEGSSWCPRKEDILKQSRYHVVITDCDHGSIEREEEFARVGAELILRRLRKKVLSGRGGRRTAHQPYAILSRRVLENLPKCKVVSPLRVGLDAVGLKAARTWDDCPPMCRINCMERLQTRRFPCSSLRSGRCLFDKQVKAGVWIRGGFRSTGSGERHWLDRMRKDRPGGSQEVSVSG